MPWRDRRRLYRRITQNVPLSYIHRLEEKLTGLFEQIYSNKMYNLMIFR